MFEKRVELVGCLENIAEEWDAEDFASCGARGCFSEKGSSDIHDEEMLNPDYEERRETIFKETSGRGHGAVLDQSEFVFSIDNLTRASTLFLCAPQYASHLQQSLRRATAERGFYLPDSLIKINGAKEIMQAQFELYEEMQKAGIPGEDARFILPLYTKTAIQTKMDARELMHLDYMSKREGVPSEVRDTVEQMVKLAKEKAPKLMKERENNYEPLAWLPAPQLFAKHNEILEEIIQDYIKDNSFYGRVCPLPHSRIQVSEKLIKKAIESRDEAGIANLKHYHFTFLAPMSLATFHQATRQRTWDQSVQSIYNIVKKENIGYITPMSIGKSSFDIKYHDLNRDATTFVKNNLKCSNDVLGILPHSVRVYDLIHINGWNAIHSIGKRTCTEAQWEIRTIAKGMANYIKEVAPEIGKYAVPQGKTYGKCPERKSCGKCSTLK